MTVKKIYIDPRFRVNYASYYILGIFKIFGIQTTSFSSNYFETDLYKDLHDYDKGLCLVIKTTIGDFKRVFIDFHDLDTVSIKHYEWCDLYAKINVKSSSLENFPKILAIGPSFAVNMLNFSFVFKVWLKLLFIKKKPVSLKTYLRDYMFLVIRRKKYDKYLSATSKDDYIFAISTLWYDPLTASTTNKYRAEFLKIAKSIYPNVEGGLFYISNDSVNKQFPIYDNYLKEYSDHIYTKRVSAQEYINKTKMSSIVFNTPSVAGCHGWKLAEYLAMGKAIISTKLNNEMPGDFNGSQMVLINNIEELRAAIVHLKTDKDARKILEEHASNYFNNELAPEQVIKRIINKLEL